MTTLVRFQDRLAALLLRRDALDIMLAVQAIAWGLWIAQPLYVVPAVAVFMGPYGVSWLPDWMVGMLFVAHGAAYLLAIQSGSCRWVRRSALANAAIWVWVFATCLAVRFLFGADMDHALPMYAANALASMWLYVVRSVYGS